jgi:hypothetical protein
VIFWPTLPVVLYLYERTHEHPVIHSVSYLVAAVIVYSTILFFVFILGVVAFQMCVTAVRLFVDVPEIKIKW